MLSQLVGQLLFFFAAVFLFSSTASADTATWLFPAYVPNAPPIAFESQDTIDVSVSDFSGSFFTSRDERFSNLKGSNVLPGNHRRRHFILFIGLKSLPIIYV